MANTEIAVLVLFGTTMVLLAVSLWLLRVNDGKEKENSRLRKRRVEVLLERNRLSSDHEIQIVATRWTLWRGSRVGSPRSTASATLCAINAMRSVAKTPKSCLGSRTQLRSATCSGTRRSNSKATSNDSTISAHLTLTNSHILWVAQLSHREDVASQNNILLYTRCCFGFKR